MNIFRYIMALCLCISTLTACKNCGCGSDPLNDTEFTIAYKLVDGSWDTTQRKLPHATQFWVGSTEKGTYALYYKKNANDYSGEIFKTAVIDYQIVDTTLILDTATKKVELVDPVE